MTNFQLWLLYCAYVLNWTNQKPPTYGEFMAGHKYSPQKDLTNEKAYYNYLPDFT